MLSKTSRIPMCPYGPLTRAQQCYPPKQSYQTHIETRCAQPGSRQPVQWENSSQNGPNLDVPQKLDAHGQRKRFGRKWNEVPTNPLSPLKKFAHFKAESKAKVEAGQATIVEWDDIKDNPPPQLKKSLIAAIPHKSKYFQSILDLSFRLRLKNGGILNSVDDTTIKSAQKGALDQLGHALSRIIHAFAEAEDNAKIFMAKWDIKYGFWRMDCEVSREDWGYYHRAIAT
jgi:hypothetical protein